MVRVRVCATTANVGPGFDCVGAALSLYNTVTFEESDTNSVISGGVQEKVKDDNIFIKSAKLVYDTCGVPFNGIAVKQKVNIPAARGLGSSAACIVSSLFGANALLSNPIPRETLIDMAAGLEGHPDNTTPCITGGICFCVYENGHVVFNRTTVGRGLMFCAVVPRFRMKTSSSRKLIPQKVSYEDAAFNISRVAFLAGAFYERDYAKLARALADRMHQPYRLPHIEGASDVMDILKRLSPYGVYLSGAGPTIMALVDASDKGFVSSLREQLAQRELSWRVIPMYSDRRGVVVENA